MNPMNTPYYKILYFKLCFVDRQQRTPRKLVFKEYWYWNYSTYMYSNVLLKIMIWIIHIRWICQRTVNIAINKNITYNLATLWQLPFVSNSFNMLSESSVKKKYISKLSKSTCIGDHNSRAVPGWILSLAFHFAW